MKIQQTISKEEDVNFRQQTPLWLKFSLSFIYPLTKIKIPNLISEQHLKLIEILIIQILLLSVLFATATYAKTYETISVTPSDTTEWLQMIMPTYSY